MTYLIHMPTKERANWKEEHERECEECGKTINISKEAWIRQREGHNFLGWYHYNCRKEWYEVKRKNKERRQRYFEKKRRTEELYQEEWAKHLERLDRMMLRHVMLIGKELK